jgi:hypothetical protein
MIVVPLNDDLPMATAKGDRTGAPGRLRRVSGSLEGGRVTEHGARRLQAAPG